MSGICDLTGNRASDGSLARFYEYGILYGVEIRNRNDANVGFGWGKEGVYYALQCACTCAEVQSDSEVTLS